MTSSLDSVTRMVTEQTMSVDRLRWMLEAVERFGRYPIQDAMR